MRFHILGVPHTIASSDYTACAYTQKAVKFAKMMAALGHECIHYGHEDSTIPGAEHVTTLSRETFERVYGSHDHRAYQFRYDVTDDAYREFYRRTPNEIAKRAQRGDFVLPFWGAGVRPVCDACPSEVITVEPGIGYAGGHWAKYKVFESYAILHAYHGTRAVANCPPPGWNYEVVIPNYFDADEFEFWPREEKMDYMLFLGRNGDNKGLHIALQLAEHTGRPLAVAGQGAEEYFQGKRIPDKVRVVGHADAERRKLLMSGARCFIIASQYLEPFGGTQIEAMLSGTPVISTDWGAFAEYNLHGLTGFRCRTFEHFVWAVENADQIDPHACRQWALENFTLERIGPLYEEFFQMVHDQECTPEKWYHLRPGRVELDWLAKRYPSTRLPSPTTRIEEVQSSTFDYETMVTEERPFADRLAAWIRRNLQPDSVLDIGCGPGHFVEAMIERGMHARGIDLEPQEYQWVSQGDITKRAFRQYGLVLCLEVAEHIPEEDAERVVNNIVDSVKPGGHLIFTAAAPGQGGVGHVNCKPRQYWCQLFESSGLWADNIGCDNLYNFAKSGYHMGWFTQNLLMFRKPQANISPSHRTTAITTQQN